MASYLEEFQAKVKAAHRKRDKLCHWTRFEEAFAATPVLGATGPCDCPTHKGTNAPCAPHGCRNCASTDDVLGIDTPAKGKYQAKLAALKDNSATLDVGIAKGKEAYDKARSKGLSPSEALGDSTFSFMEQAYWGVHSAEYKAVRKIADLELDVEPSGDGV